MKRFAWTLFSLFALLLSRPAFAEERACNLATVQRLEARLPASIVHVHDGGDGLGFLVEGRRVVTSWSLLVMRRGPEVVLADGSRYEAHVADVQGDIAVLALDGRLGHATRPQVKPEPLPMGADFLDPPPHLLTYVEDGELHLEYETPDKDEAQRPAYARDLPQRGLPILTCDGAVIGVVQSVWGSEIGPTRRERATIVSMLAGRADPQDPGDMRWGVGYDALTGLVDSRGIGGLGISVGPKWTYADRLQLDMRAEAFLLFNSHHIGGRFQGGLAAGPRLRLTDGLYFVPQLGGEVTVTTTALVQNESRGPCSESASCVETHEKLRAIEGEPALVPFGRLNLETGLADGMVGGNVFYSLHVDPRDDSKTHHFGFGLQF